MKPSFLAAMLASATSAAGSTLFVKKGNHWLIEFTQRTLVPKK